MNNIYNDYIFYVKKNENSYSNLLKKAIEHDEKNKNKKIDTFITGANIKSNDVVSKKPPKKK
jgi:hypothetical protein